jgi:hypothetical protein
VDLLKIDVEGAEREIFESLGESALDRVRAVLVECHPWLGTDLASIARQLEASGMRVKSDGNLLLLGLRE